MHLPLNNPLPYTLTATLANILLIGLLTVQYPSPTIFIVLLGISILTTIVGLAVCIRISRTDQDGILSARTGPHVLFLMIDVLILLGFAYYLFVAVTMFP